MDDFINQLQNYFVDNAVNESKTEVLLANKAEYDKIVRGGE